tara:strand:+ start:492 stop:809 length:318 start_codon:yes stop_codon:yes gene_type:complete
MRPLLFLAFIMLFQSCMVSFKRNQQPVKNYPPSAEIIQFEKLDVDKNGNISKEEVEAYNSLEEGKRSGANASEPLLFFSLIVGSIFIICLAPKIYNFILGFFKNK